MGIFPTKNLHVKMDSQFGDNAKLFVWIVIWKKWFLPIWEEVLLDEREVVFCFMLQCHCFCILKIGSSF